MAFCRFKVPRAPKFCWTQSFNKEKDVGLITILGDSWTSKGRFRQYIVDENPRQYIDIRPHGIVADVNSISCTETITCSEGAFVSFLSKSSATLNAYLADSETQGKWARDVPEVTVLHVGACDIANTNRYTRDNVKNLFVSDLVEFLEQWPILAKKQLAGFSIADQRSRNRFSRQLEKHKWLIVGIPNWHGSQGINGIEPEDFKQLKKRANTGLDRNKTKLWTDHRAVLVTPHINYATFKPGQVHLTDKDQLIFNEQVLSVAAKVLCEFCPWTPNVYEYQEHKNLLEHRNTCSRKLDPRRDLIGSPFQKS